MSFTAWGVSTGAYDAVAGYDVAARAVGSTAVTITLYLLLVRLRAVPDLSGRSGIHERTGTLLMATCLGFSAGMLYEIGAWAAHGLFGTRAFTFDELIGHMGIYLIAALAGAELLVTWSRAGWATRRVDLAAQ